MAARWNTTVEGAMEVEKDIQFDKALYDELRRRRDFGFEQVTKHSFLIVFSITKRQSFLVEVSSITMPKLPPLNDLY